MAAFDGACEGRAALVLVSGYSGIGKTSLISELYRPIVRQRGYFLAGKFDQIAKGRDHLAPVKFSRVQYSGPDDWGFFYGPSSQNRRYKKNNSSLNDFFNNMFGGGGY